MADFERQFVKVVTNTTEPEVELTEAMKKLSPKWRMVGIIFHSRSQGYIIALEREVN